MGVRIEHVLETHNHADHVSGHGRLAAATGATIHIHRLAEPEYDHEPFDDGWELELGPRPRPRAAHARPPARAHRLRAGRHRPRRRAWAVLTGDTLFVGDIARPDLAVDSEEGARGIFRSLHEQAADAARRDCEVWPGHLGGSLCGGPGMDMKVCSTIGFERAHNDAARASTDEDEFVARTHRALGPQPPNFEDIVALNRGPLVTRRASRPTPLDARARSARRSDGGRAASSTCAPTCSSTRPTSPARSASPPLRAGFGSKLAWLADREQPRSCWSAATTRTPCAPRDLAAAVGIAPHRRLPGRRHDQLARGEARRRRGRAHRPCAELHDRWQSTTRCRCSTSASRPSGTRATSPASVHAPYHDIDDVPDGLDPDAAGRRDLRLGPARAPSAASLLQRHGAARRHPRRRRRRAALERAGLARRAAGARDGQAPWCRSRRSPSGWPSASPSACSAAAARCSPCPSLVYVLGQASTTPPRPRCVVVTARGAGRRRRGTPAAGRVCWRHAGDVHRRGASPASWLGTLLGRRGRGDAPARAASRSIMLAAAAATWRKATAPRARTARRAGHACPPLRLPARPRRRPARRPPHRLLRRRRRLPHRPDARGRARLHRCAARSAPRWRSSPPRRSSVSPSTSRRDARSTPRSPLAMAAACVVGALAGRPLRAAASRSATLGRGLRRARRRWRRAGALASVFVPGALPA